MKNSPSLSNENQQTFYNSILINNDSETKAEVKCSFEKVALFLTVNPFAYEGFQ